MTTEETAANFRRVACESKGATPQSTLCECGGVLGPVVYYAGERGISDRIECDKCGASARDRHGETPIY